MNRFDHLVYCARSETGAVRANNEDAYLDLPADGVFAVADGMGGGSAGEVASAMLCGKLRELLSESLEDSPGLRKYNAQQAIHAANDAVCAYAAEHHYSQMGTTLVLLLLDPWNPAKALLCHLGDSRAYRLRRGELTQLTADHNLGSEMGIAHHGVFARRLNPAEERTARLLTRAVGISRQVLPEWRELELREGDRLLLCTDGLTSVLELSEIRQALKQCPTLEEVVERLRVGIQAAGASDNFTLLCLELKSPLPPAVAPPSEELEESEYLMRIAEWRNDHA